MDVCAIDDRTLKKKLYTLPLQNVLI
jgi:hypothetical protein